MFSIKSDSSRQSNLYVSSFLVLRTIDQTSAGADKSRILDPFLSLICLVVKPQALVPERTMWSRCCSLVLLWSPVSVCLCSERIYKTEQFTSRANTLNINSNHSDIYERSRSTLSGRTVTAASLATLTWFWLDPAQLNSAQSPTNRFLISWKLKRHTELYAWFDWQVNTVMWKRKHQIKQQQHHIRIRL